MRSEIRNLLHVTPETFWDRLFFDQDFNEGVYREMGFETYAVEREERNEAGDVERVVRGVPPLRVPGIIKRRLDGRVYYREEGQLEAATGVWSFVSQPSVVPDQVDIRGRIHLEPHPEGCTHVCELNTRITAWGIGRLIERIVDRNTRESYTVFTAFTNRWAREKGLAIR